MNKNRSKGEDVIVGFKYIPFDKKGFPKQFPSELELASVQQSDRLEELDKKRNGTHGMPDLRTV